VHQRRDARGAHNADRRSASLERYTDQANRTRLLNQSLRNRGVGWARGRLDTLADDRE
jgi:hypothetical protein